MFNATVAFLIPFVGLSINAGIQRKLVENNENESKEYIYNALIIFAVATVIVWLMLLVFSNLISKYTAIPKTLFPHVMIFSASSVLCNVILAFFQIKEKIMSYALFQNACTALNVIMSIFMVVIMGMSLNGRVYGITYSKLIFAIIAAVFIYQYINGNHSRINKNYIKDEILNFALPLIPTEIKATVLTYTDRIFLTNMISVATTGVYSLGNQFSLPILVFEQAFNLAFVPWLYKKLQEGRESDKRKIVKLTYMYFIIVLVVAILWSITAKPLIVLISGVEYKDAYLYVFWLSLGYAFVGMHMMVVNYIYYVKRLNFYSIVTVAVMSLNIVLNVVLIKQNGSIGAAQATMICNLLSFISTWILSSRMYPMPWLYFKKK